MYQYEQLKIFHHDHFIQVYIYSFMYVDPGTMPVDDNFPATKTSLTTTRNFQLQDQSQNIGFDLYTHVQKIMS